MTQLIQQTGSARGRAVSLNTGKCRIGRNPANDIVVDEPSISIFHGEFSVSDIGVFYTDLGSTNGSFLNGQPLNRGMLGNGQFLRLGSIDFFLLVPPVAVEIPKIIVPEQKHAHFLEDGSPACQEHTEVLAGYRCLKCEEFHCGTCVRRTGLIGKKSLFFCPTCSGKCEPLWSKNSTQRTNPFKSFKSLMARLGHVLYLTRPKNR